jgi:hypothetical protein
MKEKYLMITSELIAFLCMFFMDLYSAMIAVGFLVTADTITGIWAAWAAGTKKEGSWIKGWTYVESRKMERVIKKLILYPLVLIVAKVSQIYLAPVIPWIDITAGALAMVEVRSIFENVGKLLGYDLWTKIKDTILKDQLGETSK